MIKLPNLPEKNQKQHYSVLVEVSFNLPEKEDYESYSKLISEEIKQAVQYVHRENRPPLSKVTGAVMSITDVQPLNDKKHMRDDGQRLNFAELYKSSTENIDEPVTIVYNLKDLNDLCAFKKEEPELYNFLQNYYPFDKTIVLYTKKEKCIVPKGNLIVKQYFLSDGRPYRIDYNSPNKGYPAQYFVSVPNKE